jgi:hypothetical protein
MLEIRYSAPCDLEVSATVDELQKLRQGVLNLIASEATESSFEADSAIHPTPYHSALSKQVIVKTPYPTRISLQNETEIHIESSPSCLEAFASFFDFKSSDRKGEHSHYEYHEGNDCIAPDSMPLVISVK